MTSHPHLTIEEFENNYEWKIAKKLIKQTFPWVKEVLIKEPEELNKYGIIFIDFVIDPWEYAKEKDLQVSWFVKPYLTPGHYLGNDFKAPYLSIFYKGTSEGTNEEPRHTTDDMLETLSSIHTSSAIPPELKLPRGRSLGVGSFYLSPDSKPLDSNTENPVYQ